MTTTTFTSGQTAQGMTITNNSGDSLYFMGSGVAGNARITNNSGGSTAFYDVSSGVNSNIDNSGGSTYFRNNASADQASISSHDAGFLDFRESSTAANATITNGLTGTTYFEDAATAASATINNTAGAAYFKNNSTASSSNIVNTGSGFVDFVGNSTAGAATILNDASMLVSGTTGSYTDFENDSTAGLSTITSVNGGRVVFYNNSTGGSAKLITNGATSSVEFSLTTGPDGSHKVSAGSISGSGTIYLGANELTVGSLGLDDAVSGAIVDGGRGNGSSASLVKVGSGSLTLSGANTYSGGTTLVSGTLVLASTAAAGSGTVTFTNGAQTLRIDQAALSSTSSHALANTLAGFAADGDVIDLRGVGTNAGVSFNYLTDMLTVTNAAHSTVATLKLTGSYAGYAFTASSDGVDGIKVTASTPSAILNVALAHDTAPTPAPAGATTDGVTSDPTLTGQTNPGATLTFMEGSTTLGTRTTADGNFSFAFNGNGLPTLADGAHTITVKESYLGQVAKTVNVSFTLDTKAPAAPTGLADAAIKGGYVNAVADTATQTLTGTAESGSLVTVYDGTTKLGTAMADAKNGAFSYTIGHLADGSHNLTATATDIAGNTGTASTALTFTVDTVTPAAPTVTLTSDTGASSTDHITSNAGIIVTPAEAGGSLSYVVDGGPTAASYTAPTAQGVHTVSVAQTDAAGNVSAAGTLTFTLDTIAPAAPTGLADAAIVAGFVNAAADTASQTLTGTAAAGSLVTVYDGQTKLGTTSADATSGAFSYTLGHLADGSHSLTATATDTAGNTGSASAALAFVVDTMAPSLALSDVSGQANHETGHVLSGTIDAADAGDTITICDGSTVLGTTTADSSGAFSFAFSDTKDGPTHSDSLTATATDAAGNTGVSNAFVFNFDYTPNQSLFGTVAHDTSSHVGQVYALYEGLLDRAPDQGGAQGWVAALDAGASLASVTLGFLNSIEEQGHITVAGNSNAAYVEQLYETVLHRQGDASGAQGWVDFLDHGASRIDVADAFVFSQEHESQLSGAYQAGVYLADPTDAAVARLYYGLLDRAPDAGGLQTWEGAAHNGASLSSIAQGFLTSPEYQALHPSAQTDQQFVDGLYQDALGRTAEPTGEQGWLNALAHGTSRADVAIGIAESVEAQTHLAGHIDHGWHLA